MIELHRKSAAAVFALALLVASPAAAEPFEFVVLGDMPYGQDQVGSLKYIASQIERQGPFPFLVHYGDIKRGDGDCSDALLTARRDLIRGLMPGGVFYTPGDNDWTDCDRPGAGGYDELERLEFLRSLFYGSGLPDDPAWRIGRQEPRYPENARWQAGGLVFATLHIVGSDNGRAEILESDPETALDAVDARDRANLEWLSQAFAAAGRDDSTGLVVLMQADPGELEHPEARNTACGATERTVCNPYLPFLEALTEQADALQKPVLLVHGSTNSFCMDRGFGGWRAPNLWRLNGPGDFVTVDAAIVRFGAEARFPFEVRGVLSNDSPPPCVPRRG